MKAISKLEQIQSIANDKNYVCIDLFDTLIYRSSLNYSQILATSSSFAAELLKGTFRSDISSKNFLKQRRETTLSLKNEENTHGREPELAIVFERILEQLGITPVDAKELAIILVEFELSLELSSLKATDGACELLQNLKLANKIVVIITDMYFAEEDIRKILCENELEYFVDHLFVSSKFGATKKERLLFSLVLETLDVKPYELIHIGDNLDSDVRAAESMGIEAVHYSSVIKRIAYLAPNDSKAPIHELVSRLVLAFTFQIARRCKVFKITRLYFLSRDATAIGNAFELVMERSESVRQLCKNVEIIYLSISRASISFLNFYAVNPRLRDVFTHYLKYKGRGFALSELAHVLGLTGYDNVFLDHRVETYQDCCKLESLLQLNSKQASDSIVNSVITHRDLAVSYLRQERVIEKWGEIGFVDIGYAGSIGREVSKFVSERGQRATDFGDFKLHMLLLCTGNAGEKYAKTSELAFRLSDSLLTRANMSILQQLNYSWLEVFFQSPHLGSLSGYEMRDGLLKGKFSKPDSDNNNAQMWLEAMARTIDAGKLTDFYHDKYFVNDTTKQFVDALQNPSLETVLLMGKCNFKRGRLDSVDTSIVALNLSYRDVLNPTRLRKLLHEDLWLEGSLVASELRWLRFPLSALLQLNSRFGHVLRRKNTLESLI